METVSTNISFGGKQGVYRHTSTSCGCEMTFSVFLPPQAETEPCPVLFYLSGLTCTHANVTEKGEFRRAAAEHGIIIVCPDTSPRGDDTPDDEAYFFGQGAGFYLDATAEPFNANYNMYSYVTQELPELIGANFNADMSRQSIFGHSMGGHGAISIALKNPDQYKSVSAFAPICSPIGTAWGDNALSKYLADRSEWDAYDSVELIKAGHKVSELLVDQGAADEFMADGLRPELLKQACAENAIDLTYREHPGYDHSYYFISTFMADHISWHAERMR